MRKKIEEKCLKVSLFNLWPFISKCQRGFEKVINIIRQSIVL